MKRALIMFCGASMLLMASVSGYAQCQDQICTFSGGCFKCLEGGGTECHFVSCRECTSTACPSASRAAAACSPRERLFDLTPVNLATRNIPSTQFLPLSEENAPARLLSFTVTRQGILRHVAIFNNSKKEVIQYRLGWVRGSKSKHTSLELGSSMTLREPLAAGAKGEVSDFLFPASVFQPVQGLTRVGFFVASVTFEDGSSWHANLKALKKHAAAREHGKVRL